MFAATPATLISHFGGTDLLMKGFPQLIYRTKQDGQSGRK
ncbi:hypothetical protein NY08_3053 [Rhodococcus sp. B7740]|nr:hypothetical protein NY08_3053 [Rhodococcus sp. B7740]